MIRKVEASFEIAPGNTVDYAATVLNGIEPGEPISVP
jgi:hypothetical protein